LLREAKAAGATRVMNGDIMLVVQTATAFELWTGEKAPMDVIKQQLKASRNKPELPVDPSDDPAAGTGSTDEAGDVEEAEEVEQAAEAGQTA
jgi:hypothetical protein